ncbi:MAG: translation initiation factor IF-2 N-terminal domain-containing protein, partial [Phycisphaerales bacterium]|nr:translation initiation factor IF-2 N-terminal domain-containing protein [Phycisphaerales bacterium]
MAKKATQNRVHKIAKELGVTSKDIIAKCKSEDIPNIKTYQSAVSAGLEATIKEWFSEAGAKSTAIEQAEKVDITKVKAKAKKTKKKVAGNATPAASPAKATAKKTAESGDTPEKVMPLGRVMDVPEKAKMAGPRVIRIEKPEPEPKPRQPRRRPGPAPQGGSGVRMPQQMPPPQDDGRGGRKNKRKEGAPKQSERGSKNPGTTQNRNDASWRKQDLLERENRLRR